MRQVRWSGIPVSLRVLKFVMIHTVKGFCVVNETEVDAFPKFPCFLWSNECWQFVLCFLCLNQACISESSRFKYCWSLWRILNITSLAWEVNAIGQKFEHSSVLPFFGIGMKTDFFQSCGHCWVFQICWHMECRTLTPSSFCILNISAGIPSLLLT